MSPRAATTASGLVARAEHAIKAPVWGCQMCGQCVLHATGLTCPMTCPKQLRNGPCGGVRSAGHREVRPEMRCVTAEDERLPLVARHGAAVIGPANDETGIPETPAKPLECARKIPSAANDHGIATEDVIIDPLAMTVGAATDEVTTTLATISVIRDELGVNMCLGASNVSFGLPQRQVLNAGFLPMAMAAGLTSAIMSTAEVCVQAVRAADLLLGHDPWGSSWIAAHRRRQAETAAVGAAREGASAA